MKRILLTLASALLLGCGLTQAQQTTKVIQGVVIDPDGNPVPGAEIRATNGAEVITSDADGTYEMEVPFYLTSITVSYPGFKPRKTILDAAPYYVTQFKPSGGRKGLCGFLDVVGAPIFPLDASGFDPGDLQGQIGLMGGATYNGWGGYAKIMLRVGGAQPYPYHYDSEFEGSIGLMPIVTIGGMRQFSNVFGLFCGAGIGINTYCVHEGFRTYDINGLFEGNYYNNIYHSLKAAVEVGGTFNFTKHFNCVFGLTYILPVDTKKQVYTVNYDYYGGKNHGWLSPFFGLGYTFTPKK